MPPLRLLHAADRIFVWSLPVYSLVAGAHLTAWYLPLGAVALHKLVTLGRRRYWQLNPSTAGWCLAVFGWCRLSLAAGLVGMIASLLIPLPRLNGVKGRFSCGVVDYEVSSGHSGEQPTIIGRMIYPTTASGTSSRSADYIAFGDKHGLTRRFIEIAAPAALRKYLPTWSLSHWAAMRIDAAYAPILMPHGAASSVSPSSAPAARELPVVIFSHGLTASRETSTSLALALTATSGAAVLLVEHTDRSSALARFADGTSVAYDPSVMDLGSEPATPEYRSARRAQCEVRAHDLRGALAFLDALNAGHERVVGAGAIRLGDDGTAPGVAEALRASFQGRLAMGNIAVGGHSFGGATALCFAADHLCKPPPPSQDAPLHPPPAGAALGACFTLDPAVDWTPPRVWDSIGYDGIFNDKHYPPGQQSPPADLADAAPPPLAKALPMLSVWSEGWVRLRWYQCWAARVCGPAAATRPAATLTIAGSGHQGLCDLAHTLPHWLNAGLKNTLGAPSAEMDRAVAASVVSFLQLARVLPPPAENKGGGGVLDLRAIPSTKGHRVQQ